MVDYGTLVFEPPPVDLDGDGTKEQFTFEFSHMMEQTYETRTEPAVEGGTNLVAVVSDLIDSLDDSEIPDSGGRRQDFKLDLGGGVHVVEIRAVVSKDSTNTFGTGDGDAVTDETGGDPVAQIQLLDRVLQLTKIDSINTATVSIGDYDDANGKFPSLKVAPEQPSATFDGETESSTATVNITFVDIFSLDQPVDAANQTAA